MKSLFLFLFLTGCTVWATPTYPEDYSVCVETVYPTSVCAPYYDWRPGWWTIGGVWHDGHYILRGEFRHDIRDHRLIVRHR